MFNLDYINILLKVADFLVPYISSLHRILMTRVLQLTVSGSCWFFEVFYWCILELIDKVHLNFRCTLIWAVTCNLQQCGILTCVDSDEPVQPPVNLRNTKGCSVSSLTVIEYSSDKQRLWSDCAYAQAELRFCWSHIPHCWKSHAAAQL